MSKEIREQINKFEQFSNKNSDNKILYHRISPKIKLNYYELIPSVINKGLIPYDNGEIGPVIWFSDDYDDYSNTGKFVVSIEYNDYTKEKYDIYYDGHNGYGRKPIPFSELTVIKIPILELKGMITTNNELIKLINNKPIKLTPERLNSNPYKNKKIYADLFNIYVQPYINIPNFIDKLDKTKIEIINIL